MHTKPQIEHDYLPHTNALLRDTHVHKLSLTHPEINNRNISKVYVQYIPYTQNNWRSVYLAVWQIIFNPPNLNDVISDI